MNKSDAMLVFFLDVEYNEVGIELCNQAILYLNNLRKGIDFEWLARYNIRATFISCGVLIFRIVQYR